MKTQGIKYVTLIIILLAVIYPLFGLNEYEANKVKDFKNGNGENELQYEFPTWGFPLVAPINFMITSNEEIVITDQENRRIVLYDINFNYKREKKIPADSILHTCRRLFWDEHDNIVGVSNGFGIEKVNNKMEIIFKRSKNAVPLEVLGGKNIFLLEDKILYYDNELKMHMLNANGIEIPADEVELIVDEINKKNPGTIRNREINDYLESNGLILFGDRLLNTNPAVVYKYFQYIQQKMKNIQLINKISTIRKYTIEGFIGFDRNDNSYWTNYFTNDTRSTIVLSKYGEVLDYFRDFPDYEHKAVAPNGDMYYLFFNDKTQLAEVYKISRQWGLDQEVATEIEEEIPHQRAVIKKLLYTNYLEEAGIIFHPIKVFDDKAGIPWKENSRGSGIGNYIGAEFEENITVDEIEILIGYFRRGYFVIYNRIKKLVIEISGKRYEKEFEDKMVPQKIVFENPVTFKKIKFIIKEVYKSDEFDETAITEIRFYYKGKKIEIDVSKYAEFLE